MFYRQRMQQVEQRHGIQPAGNCHEHSLSTRQEFPRADGLLYVIQQVCHKAMLTQREAGATLELRWSSGFSLSARTR
jgi:hypothetical protein